MSKPTIATLIKADGTEISVSPENGAKHFTLRHMQRLVGGSIEVARCKDSKQIMVINEEGKLLGLPVNKKATELYIYGDLDPTAWERGVGDQINGDVLLGDLSILE